MENTATCWQACWDLLQHWISRWWPGNYSVSLEVIFIFETTHDPYFPLIIYSIYHLFYCRLTAITQLVHHGLIFVPIGYTFGAGMFEMEKVKGGSPYGAGTYAGDGSRSPSELELEQAFHQGQYIATIAKKLKGAA